MPLLNYTVPPFQFTIGSFDASDYLDAIALSVPIYEPGQALLWGGDFEISNNLAARSAGLTDADFDEFQSPARWRPYQQQVRLKIRGYDSPVFRIENYRYNALERRGRGRLTQIPTAVAGDRPGQRIGSQYRPTIDIEEAISKLITAAFKDATVQPLYSNPSTPDNTDIIGPLSTRDPWQDANKLTSVAWRWLTVNRYEVIESVNGAGNPSIFSRNLDGVELVPDVDAIYQTALSVTVTGARQVVDTERANSAPRPKNKTTREQRPLSTVFSGSSDDSPIVFEEKTIIYQYWDDPSWSEYLPGGVALGAYAADIDDVNQSGITPLDRPTDLNTPLQTITVKRQPTGYLYSTAGSNTALTTAEVLVESNLRKLTLKPKGVIFGTSDTSLLAEKRETLTSAPIPVSAQIDIPSKDENGNDRQYEPRPQLEDRQPLATTPLKTETIAGAARIAPLGWTPILAKPLVVDFGYLPDTDRARQLAQRIAIREQQRRDQVLVDMPIPDEWLAAGWPLLHKCQIGGDVYLMDGIAIAISLQDGKAKFGFTGGLFGKATTAIIDGVPTIVAQSQYQIIEESKPSLVFEVSVASAPAAATTGSLAFDMVVGSGIRLDLTADLLLEAVVAALPGILSPSDVVFEAIVTVVLLQTVTLTVSPSSEIEGDPAIQTVTLTVSPSSEIEGSPAIQTVTLTVSPISELEG